MKKVGVTDKQNYLASLKGRISYVLQTLPDSKEFTEYKQAINNKV